MTNQALRRQIFRSLVDQRGSALVMGLMLVFIMTLLGLAIFDIARLDARLKIDNQTGVQALEIAEAGLERGLHLFYLEFVCGGPDGDTTGPISPANCAIPPRNANYLDPPALARIPLTTDCPAALLPDGATGFKVLKQDQSFAGGTYTVCVRPHPDTPTNNLKAQFRSQGALTSVTGTAARIVQIDASANVTANKPYAPFAIGGPSAGPFLGNALIAGSLQLVRCPGAGCVAVAFGGSGGIQNNYTGLNPTLLSLIPSKFQDGTTVNTLGAVLKVKEGQVQLNSNSACIGKQESGSGCPGGATALTDTMTGVYSSGTWGGSNGSCGGGLNGATTLNRRCNVWTSAQGAYPTDDPAKIPLLSDSTIIDGKGYCWFFNPSNPTCSDDPTNPHKRPVPEGTNFPEYFYTGAWRIDDSRGDDPDPVTDRGGCDIAAKAALGTTGTAADCTKVLTALATGAKPIFDPLKGPVITLPIKAKACQRQGGLNNDTACTLQIAAGHIIGRIVAPAFDAPIRPDGEPINVYVKRRAGAPADTPTVLTSDSGDGKMYYQGSIMILADNPAGTPGPGFEIDTGLLSLPTINQSWCSLGPYLCGYAYPANHFVGLLTTGNIKLGPGAGRLILGALFAANDAQTAKFYVDGSIGQTQIAGTLSAQQFDFTGAGGVPALYQAPWNVGALPGAVGPGAGAFVSIVSSNWAQIQ